MSFSEGGQHSSIKKPLVSVRPHKSPTFLSIFSQIICTQLENHWVSLTYSIKIKLNLKPKKLESLVTGQLEPNCAYAKMRNGTNSHWAN